MIPNPMPAGAGSWVGLDPTRVTIMLKPVGAACNLRCHYCYYLPTASGESGVGRMGADTLEEVLSVYLPRAGDNVMISFQGGEPTLAGLDWFRNMTRLVETHKRPKQRVAYALQTNGTMLDDDWCRFLSSHNALVGISIDGLREDHDHYRSMADGSPSYDRVLRGLGLLRKHSVEHNVLMVLNDRNVVRPMAVWRELMRLGVNWVQFIPAVEWLSPDEGEREGRHDERWTPAGEGRDAWEGWRLASFSPGGEAYGEFLCSVFDAWFEKRRTSVSVRVFDNVLQMLVNNVASECTYSDVCSNQITIEHDGVVYGCDHYVEPGWRLGRVSGPVELTVGGESIAEGWGGGSDWWDGLDGARFESFSRRKLDLPGSCLACEWLKVCHGGCPKHRPARGELPGPSALCAGYKRFFAHTMPRFEWLAGYLRKGEMPPDGSPFDGPRSARPASATKPVRRVKSRPRRSR